MFSAHSKKYNQQEERFLLSIWFGFISILSIWHTLTLVCTLFRLFNTFIEISSAAYCTFSAAGTTINSNWCHNLRMRLLIFN